MSVTAVDTDSVAGLPVFSGLGEAELARILEAASIERLPAGTMLFQEGDRPKALHVVVSGTVEIFANRSGRDWGVMLMNAGDVLTPGAVLFDEVYTTCAQTIGTCKILIIDAATVRSEAALSGRFAMQLGRAMAGQFRLAVRQVLDLKSRNAAQRLAAFLLKVADQSDTSAPELPMRKRNLAARIGMTPETLSRTFQILADNGLVVRGRQIIVRDRERIEQFCGADANRAPLDESLQVHIL